MVYRQCSLKSSMISLIWKRKFCSKSRKMITVNLDFSDLKIFQSPESPVLPILPKKSPRDFVAWFFHILSSEIHGNMVDCRVRLNSKINFSAVCTANSQRKNAQQRWKIRRCSRLETPLWACFPRNLYELCMPSGIAVLYQRNPTSVSGFH